MTENDATAPRQWTHFRPLPPSSSSPAIQSKPAIPSTENDPCTGDCPKQKGIPQDWVTFRPLPPTRSSPLLTRKRSTTSPNEQLRAPVSPVQRRTEAPPNTGPRQTPTGSVHESARSRSPTSVVTSALPKAKLKPKIKCKPKAAGKVQGKAKAKAKSKPKAKPKAKPLAVQDNHIGKASHPRPRLGKQKPKPSLHSQDSSDQQSAVPSRKFAPANDVQSRAPNAQTSAPDLAAVPPRPKLRPSMLRSCSSAEYSFERRHLPKAPSSPGELRGTLQSHPSTPFVPQKPLPKPPQSIPPSSLSQSHKPLPKTPLLDAPPAASPEDSVVTNHYLNITTDPRYQRLLQKYDPKLKSKQAVTNLAVDPSLIPFIGLGVNIYRTYKQKESGLQLAKTAASVSYTDKSLSASVGEMRRHGKQRLAILSSRTAVDAFFTVVPVWMLMPATGAVAGVAGDLGARATAKTIEGACYVGGAVAATVSTRINEQRPEQKHAPERNLHANWDATKAFLMYLGLPRDDEEIYQPWESSRLFLKSLYGSEPHEDLYKMEPDKELEKRLAESEKQKGAYNMKELGVSLLFLMWRAHQCWDKMCWDLVKDTTKGEKTLEAQRRNHRMKDFVFLHNQLHPADKHVRKLTPQYVEDIADLLLACHTKRFSNICAETPEGVLKKRRWIFLQIALHFIETEEVWGYVDENAQYRLVSVALYGTSKRLKKQSFFQISRAIMKLSTSGLVRIGSNFPSIVQAISAEEKVLQDNVLRGGRGAVIFLLGFTTENKEPNEKLLCALTSHCNPTYTFCYDHELQNIEVITENQFHKVSTTQLSDTSLHVYVRAPPDWVKGAPLGAEHTPTKRSKISFPTFSKKGSTSKLFSSEKSSSKGYATLD